MQIRNRTNGETPVLLGKNSEFEGDLKFFGTARIEGRFKGNISGEGILIIAKESNIEADIHVSHIIVHGELHGNIFAEEKIEIKAPGKVFGNIEVPVLNIESGAVFRGECHTRKPKVAEKDELGIISSVKPIDLRARKKMDDSIEVLP